MEFSALRAVRPLFASKMRRATTALLLVAVLSSFGFSTTQKDKKSVTPQQAGELDTSFGTNGIVTTTFSLPSLGAAVAQQSDRKLVAAGASLSTTSSLTPAGSQVARYNADGSLDTSFGTGGKVAITQPMGFTVTDMAIQSDGKIVLAGSTVVGPFTTGTFTFTLLRLNSDGSVDSGFGSGGQAITSFDGSTLAAALSLAIQSDGKIVAAGVSGSAAAPVLSIVRYNADGSADTSFGTGGSVTLSVANSAAFSVVIQSDNKIVVGGSAGLNITSTELTGVITGHFVVARLNSDGSLDNSFGTSGMVSTTIGTGSGIGKLALQSDGKILAGGTAQMTTEDFAVVRYNSDGSLDTSFGTGGMVTTNFDSKNDIATAIALQSDGKIILSGVSIPPLSTQSHVNPESQVSPAGFGLVLIGFIDIPGAKVAAVRYNSDGSVDTGFGTSGSVTTSVELGAGGLDSTIQQDGKLVVVGAASSGTGMIDFFMTRYTTAAVTQGDFTLSPDKTTQTVTAGTPATFTVSVQSVMGSTPPSGPVSLAATVTPSGTGVTAMLSSTSVNVGSSSTVTVATDPTATAGSYTVAVTGTAGAVTHTVNLTVVVQAPAGPDFSLSFSSPTINAPLGSKVSVTVMINRIGGLTGKVKVQAPTGLPTGAIVKGGVTVVSTKGSSATFKIKVKSTVTPGSYPITFTATDKDGHTHTATVTLIVM